MKNQYRYLLQININENPMNIVNHTINLEGSTMRRRRTSKTKHSKDRFSAATTILVLLLIAAFIFAFQSLGIYDILFQPVSNPSEPTGKMTIPPTSSVAGTAETTAPSTLVPSGDKVSEDIKMNSITLYGVQLGVFTKQENAEASASKFKASGSAGYIMKDDALFRVVDSVFYTEADAKVLRDEYRKSLSPDACILKVEVSGVNWNVNATRDQINAIRSSLVTIQNQLVILINTQKAAQQNQGTADDWKQAITGASAQLKLSSDQLMKAVGSTKSEIILKLNQSLLDSASKLDQLSQMDSAKPTALLSGLKYSIIDILLMLQKNIMG